MRNLEHQLILAGSGVLLSGDERGGVVADRDVLWTGSGGYL